MLTAINNALNTILSPILIFPPLISVLILSCILALFTTLVTKYTTDQSLMKRLKEEMADLKKHIKEHKNNPDKFKQLQGEMTTKNLQYSQQSIKTMLFTAIPFLLILGWMTANLSYLPISPEEPFTITIRLEKPQNISIEAPTLTPTNYSLSSQNTFAFTGPLGNHNLTIHVGNQTYLHQVIISNKLDTITASTKINDGTVASLETSYNKLVLLPPLERAFGWGGWLMTYFIGSIIFSMLWRKLLKIY